jgi:hypothetical protein
MTADRLFHTECCSSSAVSSNHSRNYFRDPMLDKPIAVEAGSIVFWSTAVCCLLATLLFGMLPAWRAGGSDPGSLLKSRTSSAGRRLIAGRAFVPVQVALSLVLVTLASMLALSLMHIRSEQTGFDLDHVTIQTGHFTQLPEHGNTKLDLYQRMVDRLQQEPGIRSASLTWTTPMTGIQATSDFEAGALKHTLHMSYNSVGPGYFRTIETHIVEGREFHKNERTPDVCIVNQAAASFFFPHSDPLDASVRTTDTKKFPKPVI